MTKKVVMCLGSLTIAAMAMAQAAFVSNNRVAVFYPPQYDAAQHEPSPIFLHEPKALNPLPAQWNIRPQFSTADGKSIATVQVEGDVDFYGTGEVTGPLRRNGRTVGLWNIDTPAYGVDGGSHLYQSHPWVMGVRADGSAFGIIADNTWRQTISTLDHKVTFESQGPAFRVVVIERDSPRELMKALVDLTGTMEMPPLWALGYQQCRFSYQPDTQVMEIADKLSEHKIPADVIWMDIDYMDHYRIFTFNPEGVLQPQTAQRLSPPEPFQGGLYDRPGRKGGERLLRRRPGLLRRLLGEGQGRQAFRGRCVARSLPLPRLHPRGRAPMVGNPLQRLHGHGHRRRMERYERAGRLRRP